MIFFDVMPVGRGGVQCERVRQKKSRESRSCCIGGEQGFCHVVRCGAKNDEQSELRVSEGGESTS